MSQQSNEKKKTVPISNQALCTLVAESTKSFPGVIALDNDSADKALDILSKDISSSEGVRVSRKDDELHIDIHIVVRYGTRIPKLSWELQKRVQKEIRNITGIDAEEINVHIEGVRRENK